MLIKIIKVMLNKIDFRFLAGALISLIISLLTIAGITQQLIHFADPINEFAFTVMALMLSITFLFGIKK